MKKVYFISGHADIDIKEFSKYYLPLIQDVINTDCNFLVGDCDGVDALAQIVFTKLLPEEQHNRVKVFFKGDMPQNLFSKGFLQAGGFISHEEAAIAMTLCSDEDIAYIGYGRDGSLTGKNILRRFTKDFPYEEWMNKKNRNVEFWDIIKSVKEEYKAE